MMEGSIGHYIPYCMQNPKFVCQLNPFFDEILVMLEQEETLSHVQIHDTIVKMKLCMNIIHILKLCMSLKQLSSIQSI